MRVLDRTKMAQKYPGKWVALKADRQTVVAAGDNPRSVLEAAQKKGHKSPVITRMPKEMGHFIGALVAV